MTERELKDLIQSCESDRIEFTVSTTDTDKFSQAICAFSNDLPNHGKTGFLVPGISNDREIQGVHVTDALLLRLGELRESGRIQPLPAMTIEPIATSDGDVVVISVQPSPLPPVRFNGRVWIRLGPRKAHATPHEERILNEKRVSHALTFDAEPSLGSSFDDLDLRIFRIEYQPQAVAADVLEENHRPIEQQLASLRFFDMRNACPTNAGMILFGQDVRAWLPGAYIQFLRIDGESLDESIVQDRELSGDLLTVLRELDALVDANISQSPIETSHLRETMLSDYPIIAIRELLMNAIMHRNYASTAPLRVTWFRSRIEIQSPGGLYGEASKENFPNQTSYRNPVVAEALKALGYVNRYGRGVIRAKEALVRRGHPEPEFKLEANYVLAIVKARQ